jgi:hypothetical protein
VLPKRSHEKAETALPRRVVARRLIADPRFRKDRVDNIFPSVAVDRNDKELPHFMKSIAETELPKSALADLCARTLRPAPMLQLARNESEEPRCP